MEFDENEIKKLKKNVELTKKNIKWNRIAINTNRVAVGVVLLGYALSAVILLKEPTVAHVACSIVDTVCVAFCSFQLGTNGAKKKQIEESRQNLKNAQNFLAKIANADSTKQTEEK